VNEFREIAEEHCAPLEAARQADPDEFRARLLDVLAALHQLEWTW
jgi:hypothetical protein